MFFVVAFVGGGCNPSFIKGDTMVMLPEQLLENKKKDKDYEINDWKIKPAVVMRGASEEQFPVSSIHKRRNVQHGGAP